jgi:predicted O-methyltransferase YrrM
MDEAALARHFTMALAGRAKNVAPYLAQVASLAKADTLVDVGGGSGIYAIACLQQFPRLKAIVWDRAEVLNVAAEFASSSGVSDRLTLLPGDMFTDPVPQADAYLLSNILHDWDVPECQRLIARLAGAMRSGSQLLIHDVFLNDALDGPLPIALYSAALFAVTEGRAYSAAEYRAWLSAAGLQSGSLSPTLVHCALLPSRKP